MEEVVVVYKTDNWHSFASRDLIGVAENLLYAVEMCEKQAEKEGEKISADDLYNLTFIRQTQGYQGEGEFYLEIVTLNELL
jgi:hypothetical protein